MTRDDAKTCFIGGLLALAIICAAAVAHADEPKLPPGVTCADVRAKVAEHGQYIAYAWARMNGYSKAEIREAKKCLK